MVIKTAIGVIDLPDGVIGRDLALRPGDLANWGSLTGDAGKQVTQTVTTTVDIAGKTATEAVATVKDAAAKVLANTPADPNAGGISLTSWLYLAGLLALLWFLSK